MHDENKNVIIKYGGRIYAKEMSWAVDGKQVMRGMTECPMARNSRERMLLRETSDVPASVSHYFNNPNSVLNRQQSLQSTVSGSFC